VRGRYTFRDWRAFAGSATSKIALRHGSSAPVTRALKRSPCKGATVVVWLGDNVTPLPRERVSHPRGCRFKAGAGCGHISPTTSPTASSRFASSDACRPGRLFPGAPLGHHVVE
jgi:hypothetical protein